MIEFLLLILGSFLFTFALSIPFLNLLYFLNIRRVAKVDLENALPGRSVKWGTPIMGGLVIMLTIISFSFVVLYEYKYFYLILSICVLGAIIGAIDEYVNTLGRTIMAIRISKSNNESKQVSIIPAKGTLLIVKKMLLVPWKIFEEILRVSGSTQRGLKSHNKFLMHLVLSVIVVLFLYFGEVSTMIYLPVLKVFFDLGLLYYVFVVVLLLFFDTAFGVTDGMDGLSAGTHSIVFLILGILASYFGATEIAYLSFIILGSEIAFLYFNIHPARVEMSDVGTLPIGMLFVIVGVLLKIEVAIFFIGLTFVIEILSSLAQQWSVKLTGKRVFLVAPIHHHFEKLGWIETKVTSRFYVFTIVSGLIGAVVALL